MAGREASHLIRLEDSSWYMWREAGLRSPGFAAARIQALADDTLAELAASSCTHPERRGELERRWPAAAARSLAALQGFAADPRFREAIAWQNPSVLTNGLDGRALRPRHELLIANYAQRYTVKNDTIGFFGPIGCVRWSEGAHVIRHQPGPALLVRHAVFFETWAIDTLAQSLSEDPAIAPWICPRLVGACLLDGTRLRRPYGPPVELSAEDADLLRQCDGDRPVCTLATLTGRSVDDTFAQLRAWRDEGFLHLDFEGPVEARPEDTLRRRLQRIGDDDARVRALAALTTLEAARDAVADAAGDADRLLAAIAALNQAFETVTGQSATRRHGETYAGRTLVYVDALRAVQVDLGQHLLAQLAPPLSLVLESARWLVSRTAERYEAIFDQLFDRCRARAGTETVPLAALLGSATPYMGSGAQPPPTVNEATVELQRRWAEILQVPAGARRHHVSVAALTAAVRDAFPGCRARWTSAINYSPDLMIAVNGHPASAGDGLSIVGGAGASSGLSNSNGVSGGPSPGPGISTGNGRDNSSGDGDIPSDQMDVTLVLGELHLARNTLDCRPYAELHEDPARLRAAASETEEGRHRIYAVPPKEWPQVGPRAYPTPLRSPDATYWCQHNATAGAPGPVLPLAALTVHRQGTHLVVRSQLDGREFDLMEMIGEQLSFAVINGFKLLPESTHQPRVSIDALVVQRESWTFAAADVAWASIADRLERFRQAQAWRVSHAMPLRVFCSRPSRVKPIYVDFASIALVDLLARTIARVTEDTVQPTFMLTEMVPDLTETWLTDADGAHYTAELRCVVVDHRPEDSDRFSDRTGLAG